MPNSITTVTARAAFAQAHGTTGTLPKITHMAFGTGGVDGSNVPIPPLTTAAALGHEILRKPLESISYPVSTTVRFTGKLMENEAVGQDISEIALVDQNGAIAAIKTFTKKGKDSESQFVFDWDEEF